MGSFKIGKLKDGYIDFHDASYNEKLQQHRLKCGTPRSSLFFFVVVFCKHSDFHKNFWSQWYPK